MKQLFTASHGSAYRNHGRRDEFGRGKTDYGQRTGLAEAPEQVTRLLDDGKLAQLPTKLHPSDITGGSSR